LFEGTSKEIKIRNQEKGLIICFFDKLFKNLDAGFLFLDAQPLLLLLQI